MSEQKEQSPVYGFLKNPSMVDFPGHMAAVFFTSGCNFTCGFCHNAELMAVKKRGISWERLKEACTHFRRDWVSGAVITGGEPTLSHRLPELIAFFRSFGWAVKLDTNGSMPDVLEALLPLVDYVAMDIKAGPDGYKELVGYDNVERIERSIELIQANAADYEFRTTIIEGFHDEKQMEGIGYLLNHAKRYIMQPFIPQDTLPDEKMRKLPRTSDGTMQFVRGLMQGCADEVIVRGS